jgi:hypothetical protein
VRGRPLSYRRRRRLIALSVVAVVAAVAVASTLLLPHGQKPDHSASPVPPAETAPPKPPRPVHLTRADRASLRSTIALFVKTAVARHHPEQAWPIVAPSLREGMTKRQWRTGNIPVVPYPATGILLLNVESLDKRSALIEVLLASPPKANLVRKTFQIQLKRDGHAPHGWAVAGWVPEGVSESQDVVDQPHTPAAADIYHPTRYSSMWVVALLGLFVGALVLIPAGHFARESYRARRAEAEYQASHAERGEIGR